MAGWLSGKIDTNGALQHFVKKLKNPILFSFSALTVGLPAQHKITICLSSTFTVSILFLLSPGSSHAF